MAHEYSIQEVASSDSEAMHAALALLANHYRAQLELDPSFVLAPDWRETYRSAFGLGSAEGRHRITLAIPGPAAPTLGAAAICVHWVRSDALLQRRTTGIISELYVEPHHRGRSVARRLVVDALRWFHLQGVSVVILSTPLRGDGARFWQRLGFAASSVSFECHLDNEGR